MTEEPSSPLQIQTMAEAARNASRHLATTTSKLRSAVLLRLADELERDGSTILTANAEDVRGAGDTLDAATRQRLQLDAPKLAAMAQGVRAVAALPDPLHRVQLRGCPECRALVPSLGHAMEADWEAEYGAPILALKVVDDLDAALAHIRAHGSGHTEAIVTEDAPAAARFLAEVDAAGVFHNASTRFADGFRYGFGAEVGISTGRIHARGPVGLEGLLSYRYLLRGSGQRVEDYAGPSAKPFMHLDLLVDP